MPSADVRIYKPELLPRKGEYTAWALAGLALIGLIALALTGNLLGWAVFFVVFLFLSALSISLGNWMDRNTMITIDGTGVSFQNGLRKVRLGWNEIREVHGLPARWGDTVQVLGKDAHFEFNTLGEVVYRGEIRGRVGFSQGREIMQEIVRASGLRAGENPDSSYYYTRP